VHDERALLAGQSLSLVAFGCSLYLTYRELFTIQAIWTWCVSSSIVLTLLAIVGTSRALRLDLVPAAIAVA